MPEINKIEIRGSMGYGPVKKLYTERITLTRDRIRYQFIPIKGNDVPPYMWLFQTSDERFAPVYDEACKAVQKLLDLENEKICDKVGPTKFTVTYSDKTRLTRTFRMRKTAFKSIFNQIERLIPRVTY